MRASKIKINNVYTDEYNFKPKGRIEVPTAEQRTEYIVIKGRDGSLTKKYGYEDISLPINFTMHDTVKGFKPVFRKIKQYLFSAETLVFDDDSEVYYKVKSIKIATAENLIKEFGEFTVNFTLDPFQHEVSNDPIEITSSTTINNDGYEALPIINAYVEGTGRIYINDEEIIIENVNGQITIDSEMQNAYRKGSPPQNMNNKMEGDFPVLKNGNNTIDFDGDITKLEIIMNKRWR